MSSNSGSGHTLSMDEVVTSFGDMGTVAPVAMEIIRLADDENSSMRDLVGVIKADPGLASRLMRLANSAAYGSQEVTSLERAMALLGLHTIKLITLGFSLVSRDDDSPIDTSLIWRRSIATSVLAQRLVDHIDTTLAGEAFIAGLLSNVGKLALGSHTAYQRVLADEGPWITPDRERELLGFTSDEVSAGILNGWGLPTVIGDSIRLRSSTDGDAADHPISGVLSVADAAAILMLVDVDDVVDAFERLTITSAVDLGLTTGQVDELIAAVRPSLDDMTAMFDLESVTTVPAATIMANARDHLARLSLDVAAALSSANQRNNELAEQNEQLAEQASTDALTGLPNRRTFDAYLANQMAGRRRGSRVGSLGLILFDLDHFKSVNDTHGHQVGDDVLREVGNRIRSATRTSELSARVGGEEFAIVLPETSPPEIELAAERFRDLIASDPIETSAGPLAVTASFGVAVARNHDVGADERLYQLADGALYQSKANGRNRSTMAT